MNISHLQHNKAKLLEHLHHEACACVQLYQYIQQFHNKKGNFGEASCFYDDLMEMLNEALIVRLYCLFDKGDETVKIENIYKLFPDKNMPIFDGLEVVRSRLRTY